MTNNSGISPILINQRVSQNNASQYNKDSIDLNKFFEKMTFQDLYNDFAEENTPKHSSTVQQVQSSFLNTNQMNQTPCSNQGGFSCNGSQINQKSSSSLPLQEFSNNYQNMSQKNKVSQQNKYTQCSQTPTSSTTSMSFTTASQLIQNPFNNITNIKNNNNTMVITSVNTPSQLNTTNQQLQNVQQNPFNKQNSVQLDKKTESKQVKLKNSINEYFTRPLDVKFQQKLAFLNCKFTSTIVPTLLINPISTGAIQSDSDQINTFDLFSNFNNNSCYSLFMNQQNTLNLSEGESNTEFSIY